WLRGLGGGIVRDRLVVDRLVLDIGPVMRLDHLGPALVRLQPPLEQPLRLLLLGRNESNGLLRQAGRDGVLLDVGDETVLVLAVDELFNRTGHQFSWRRNVTSS